MEHKFVNYNLGKWLCGCFWRETLFTKACSYSHGEWLSRVSERKIITRKTPLGNVGAAEVLHPIRKQSYDTAGLRFRLNIPKFLFVTVIDCPRFIQCLARASPFMSTSLHLSRNSLEYCACGEEALIATVDDKFLSTSFVKLFRKDNSISYICMVAT